MRNTHQGDPRPASDYQHINAPIASPCIRICCLDDNDICLGCFRSLQEITQWTQVDNHTRQAILTHAKQRQQAYEGHA